MRIKRKHTEIETVNYRIMWSFPFWGRDEETEKFTVIKPRFLFYYQKREKDYSTRFYEWIFDFGYIFIFKKHHPVYDEAAKKYGWNAVLLEPNP